MNYEKAYKEALELARDYYKANLKLNNADENLLLEDIFPELKGSEDEKIRKMLIDSFTRADMGGEIYGKGVTYKQVIAWLEKQGEKKPTEVRTTGYWNVKDIDQKPFDYEHATITQNDFAPNQEPKFKVGDYIVNGYCMGRIVEITNDVYLLDTKQSIPFSWYSTHLWDITKDAKDGDVLAEDTCTFIIKKLNHDLTAEIYCCLYDNGDFELNSCLGFDDACTYPATKEQRDILFQKMKEAGYEWDADKKELKKIEKKTTWSEEDEEMAEELIKGFLSSESPYQLTHTCKEIADWLKSIKDRVKG